MSLCFLYQPLICAQSRRCFCDEKDVFSNCPNGLSDGVLGSEGFGINKTRLSTTLIRTGSTPPLCTFAGGSGLRSRPARVLPHPGARTRHDVGEIALGGPSQHTLRLRRIGHKNRGITRAPRSDRPSNRTSKGLSPSRSQTCTAYRRKLRRRCCRVSEAADSTLESVQPPSRL